MQKIYLLFSFFRIIFQDLLMKIEKLREIGFVNKLQMNSILNFIILSQISTLNFDFHLTRAYIFHNHLSSYVHILPFTISLCPSLGANISKRHSDNPPKTLGTLAPFAHAIISSTLRKHSSFTPPSLCAKHSSFQRISRFSHRSQVAHKYVIPPFIPAPFFSITQHQSPPP